MKFMPIAPPGGVLAIIRGYKEIEMEDKHTAKRIKLDDVRAGLTMKDRGCGFKYYVTVNFYPDSGAPSEVFIRIAKEGTIISGFVEALAITISIAWQYGVPWAVLYDKYLHQIFEPRDDESSSLVDAIGKTIDKVIKKHQGKDSFTPTTGPIGLDLEEE